MNSTGTGSHERIVVYWTLHDDQRHTLACELCRTAAGLEVRCIKNGNEVLRTGQVSTAGDGATVAAQWKASVLAKGDFYEQRARG